MSTLNTNPDTKIWIDDASGNVGIVDLNSGAATTIGNSGAALTDIAFSPTGQLYGVSSSEFYKIDQKTGAATPIGALKSNTPLNGLVFANDGKLYGAGDTNLYTINTTTGAATLVGPSHLPSGWVSAGDLAFLHGVLYETVTNGAVSDLAKINPSTGAGTLIGRVVADPNLFGLVPGANGVLYGVDGNNIYSINTSTGAGTLAQSYASSPNLQAANGSATQINPDLENTTQLQELLKTLESNVQMTANDFNQPEIAAASQSIAEAETAVLNAKPYDLGSVAAAVTSTYQAVKSVTDLYTNPQHVQ